MTEQSRNDVFHASSFMQGQNAAYLEQLYARYSDDPASVDEEWQAFFAQLGDEGQAKAEANGPSWARPDWPPQPNDDLTHALDGNWPSMPEADGKAIAEKIAKKAVALTADHGHHPDVPGEPHWVIDFPIEHETFDVMEDDEVFCRGIIFALRDIP